MEVKELTDEEKARIEKAQKDREAQKVGKNDSGPMRVEKKQ